MKIIFLDIDGVLNVIGQGHDEYGQIFHKHFEDNLKRIIDETGAKIVVSSSWRSCGLKVMQEMWEKRGLPGEIIDVTPSLRLQKGGSIAFYNDKLERHPTESVQGYSIPRGCEIEYWLRNEAWRIGTIDGYVILDDDTDMLMHQKEKFVQCSGNTDDEDCIDAGWGLTKKCTDQAIKILSTTPTGA
ncbi:MAG: HAD domain-containing protein [Bacteroidota bacterium]